MRFRTNTFGAICGVAILYYLTGRLGLLLAIPPGYATAVWPPSGIALAGTLLFGWRVWPGVFIGSFALNAWVSLNPTDPSSTLRSLAIAFGIASGSTLQAVLGQRVVSWISGGSASKPWEGGRAVAIAAGGSIACVTGATVGVATLALAKAITTESYPYSWMTWYVGDTIGAIIFTPIILLWAAAPHRVPLGRRLAATAPLAVTFALVVLLFTRVNALEQQQIQMEFERRSALLTQVLQRGIDRSLEAFREVGSFHDGLPDVDPSRFRAFARGLLARHPELHAIAWDVRVPGRRRAAFESDLAGEGQALGRITELDSGNRLVPAAVRREYVVVRYVEPAWHDQIGYDIASGAGGREALARARVTGEVTCAPATRLGREDERQAGSMVLLPLYWKRGRLTTSKEGAEDFAGVMSCMVRVGPLTEAVLRGVHLPGVQVAITAPPLLGGTQRLHPPSDRGTENRDAVASRADLMAASRDGLHRAGVLDVAGQRWTVEFTMSQAYLATHRSWLSWGVLAAGMAFTGLLGAYILSLLGQAARIEQLVAQRTEELRRAHEEAKSAQLQLLQAAKLESIGRLAAGVAHEVKNPLAVILFAVDYLRQSVDSADPNVPIALNDARDAVVRADGVIRDLLDFSTAADLRSSLHDVNDVLRKSLHLVHHAITKDQIRVVEEFESGLPRVMLDTNKIEQVFVNLIINAIDAMPNRGTLTVRTRREREEEGGSGASAPKTDGLRDRSGNVVVEIEDTGTGIPEATLDRLFDPFFTTKAPGKGTGLGLAVCKSIVAMHGGRIGIANIEGGGARATVVMPAVSAQGEDVAAA